MFSVLLWPPPLPLVLAELPLFANTSLFKGRGLSNISVFKGFCKLYYFFPNISDQSLWGNVFLIVLVREKVILEWENSGQAWWFAKTSPGKQRAREANGSWTGHLSEEQQRWGQHRAISPSDHFRNMSENQVQSQSYVIFKNKSDIFNSSQFRGKGGLWLHFYL